MSTIELATVELGGPRPAIIVPLTGPDDEQVLAQATGAAASPADIVEWRVDLFDEPTPARAGKLATEVAAHAARPLLATVRTTAEGGRFGRGTGAYADLVAALAASAGVELVDVECARPGAAGLVAAVHEAGGYVVGSFHDVAATPGVSEMLDRLRAQAAAGADVCKIAVMPQAPADVARLLEACALADAELDQPVIAMAMGPLGLASRLMGGDFGSAAGFASLGGHASAPGQVPVEDLVAAVAVIDRLRRA
ncbi:MAG: type I 3-dehydroquinate dehydratase [Propionibacteriaceae bacterium]|nr:type I 3-dehydroquinate dehydratase [Propionibacteriaceae bacterium]